jgi:hypothetical protein
MDLERVVEPGGIDPDIRETRAANTKNSFVAQRRRTVDRPHPGGIFWRDLLWLYWLSADEPIVTDEAYARMEVLKDVCVEARL